MFLVAYFSAIVNLEMIGLQFLVFVFAKANYQI